MARLVDLIADRFTFHAVNVQRFEAHLQNRVIDLLRKAEQRILRDLERLDPSKLLRQRQRLEALLKAIRANLQTAYAGINKETAKELVEFATTVEESTRTMVNALAEVDLLNVGIPKETFRAMLDDAIVQGAPAKEWWSRQAGAQFQRFADEIRQGVLLGETLPQLVARIRGTRDADFRDGVMAIGRREAEALVRTSVQSVLNAARMETLRANADVIKGIQALAVLDGRTTEICIARSGMAWHLNGRPMALEGRKAPPIPFPGPPPWHWQCRTTLVPITKSWAELIQDKNIAKKVKKELRKLPKSTQASMDGQVAADLNYEEWLKTKPEAFQKEILGVGKWELWKAGQISLRDLVDQRGRPIPLRELKQRFGAVEPPARVAPPPPSAKLPPPERPIPPPPPPRVAAPPPPGRPPAAAEREPEADPLAGSAKQRRLSETPIVKTAPLGGGVNGSFLAHFEDGGQGVWKPVTGEASDLRRGIRAGTYYLREAAASDVAQIVAIEDLVPATAIRRHEGTVGSIQEFRAGTVARKLPKDRAYGDSKHDRQRAYIFDAVMGNTDRHMGNWMVSPKGKLILIDHGLTLPTLNSQLRMRITVGEPMTDRIPEELKKPWRDNWPRIAKALRARGIEERAIALAKARLDRLLRPETTWNDLELPLNSKDLPGAQRRIE